MSRMLARWIVRVVILGLSLALLSIFPSGAFAAGPAPTASPRPPVTLNHGHVHIQPTRPDAQRLVQAMAAACNSGTPCQNLTYHEGPVMSQATSYLIFWLPPGVHFETDSTGDANYEYLIGRYFQDIGGSSTHNILSQYYSTVSSQTVYPVNSSALGGAFLDTNPYPRAGTYADPLLDSDLQAEIQSDIAQNNWPTGTNTMFFIFTGNGIESCAGPSDCSGTQYCAYHGWFDLNGDPARPVVYANDPDDATVAPFPYTCTSGGPYPNGDAYADSTLNSVSHEHFEAQSDPLLTGWYDQSGGAEIGDQCGWIFGPEDSSGADVYLNGDPYQIQQEWSNAVTDCTLSYTGQFINMTPLSGGTYGGSFTVSAQATSLLPLSFSSTNPGTCAVFGSFVQLVGVGACAVVASQPGGSFYTSASVGQWLQVSPAPLSAIAPNLTMAPGVALPAFTPTYTGFVNDDTAASLTSPAFCWTSATATSPVGRYPVVCSGAVDPNSAFSYVDGSLTVGVAVGVDVLSVRDNPTPASASYSLQQAANAGADWVLVQVKWSALEPARGVYDWSTVDDVLAQTEHYGLIPVLRVGDAPAWANGSADPTAPPLSPGDFGDFMAALVGHVGNRAAGYVIWNEPNLSAEWGGQAPNPAAYLTLLQQAYLGAKGVNPAAVIVSAPLAPTDDQNANALDDRVYLAQLYAAGLRSSSDVIGMNAPGFAYAPNDTSDPNQFYFTRVSQLRSIMVQNGDATKQAWAIEMGWLRDASVDLGSYDWMEVPESARARYLVQAYELAASEWPWMGVMFTWNLDYARYLSTSDQKGWFGLLDPSGTPLPSYDALAAMPKPPPTWTPTPTATSTPTPTATATPTATSTPVHYHIYLPFVANDCTTCRP